MENERAREKERAKSDQAAARPNNKDSQMLPIRTVRYGVSGADTAESGTTRTEMHEDTVQPLPRVKWLLRC